MIVFHEVHKAYARPRFQALNGVSLEIPAGAVYGLLGPNGAGKTTLISILLGLQQPSDGRVLFEGVELKKCLAEARRAIGYVPQDLAFYPMLSGRENLRFYGGAWGLRGEPLQGRMDFAVAAAGLQQHIDRPVHTYSGGLKRRLNLAIALLNNPRVLCLDEPTVGIDPQSRGFILETIKGLARDGMTVLYTSHYLEEVQQLCDRVAVIDHGRILANGPIDELLAQMGLQTLKVSLGNIAPGAITSIASELGSDSVTKVRDSSLEIETQDLPHTLGRLIPAVCAQGGMIRELNYGRRSLEDVFLQLTAGG